MSRGQHITVPESATDLRRLEAFWKQRAKLFDARYATNTIFAKWMRQSIDLRHASTMARVRQHHQPTILDIGCGSGRQLVGAIEAGAKRAVGLDLAPAMIDLAREHAARAGLSRQIECYVQNALEFRSHQRFDLVWALGVFDYIRDPLPLLLRMGELSRGRVIATFRRLWAFRSPYRWIAYRASGCPIYLHTRGDLLRTAHAAQLWDIAISSPNASFYYLEGRGPGSGADA